MTAEPNEMAFTGERYVPGASNTIAYEHLHRYALACDYVAGKAVLDIASGEGYGSALLAKVAERVVGVDVSEEAVTHAKVRYGVHKNLEFHVGSCTDIPAATGTFDVVVSFETIEHIDDYEKMLDEIKRVLKPDGILIISSPNKKTFTDDPQYKSEYHVHELYLSEFEGLLRSRFKNISLIGQRLTFSSHMWSIEAAASKAEFTHYSGDDEKLNRSVSAPFEALYFIAICTDADGISTQSSLFTQTNDSLFNSYSKLPGQLEEKAQQLAEKDGQLAEMDRQLADKCAEHERRIAEKDRQLQDLYNSWSWRITTPLRWLVGLLFRLRRM